MMLGSVMIQAKVCLMSIEVPGCFMKDWVVVSGKAVCVCVSQKWLWIQERPGGLRKG